MSNNTGWDIQARSYHEYYFLNSYNGGIFAPTHPAFSLLSIGTRGGDSASPRIFGLGS